MPQSKHVESRERITSHEEKETFKLENGKPRDKNSRLEYIIYELKK